VSCSSRQLSPHTSPASADYLPAAGSAIGVDVIGRLFDLTNGWNVRPAATSADPDGRQQTQRSSTRYRHWPFRCCSSPEEERQAHTTVLAEQGLRAAKRHDKASRQQGIGTLPGYVTTWRRWLDQAQGQQAPMPADSPTKNPARDLAALREGLLDDLLLDDDLASPTMRVDFPLLAGHLR
jgi:hypothetical protein